MIIEMRAVQYNNREGGVDTCTDGGRDGDHNGGDDDGFQEHNDDGRKM